MADEPLPALRACTKCGARKPATIEWFKPETKVKGGLSGHCRDCINERRRALWGGQNRNRHCCLCREPFQPTGTAQKRCIACRPEWERLKKRAEWKRATEVLKARGAKYRAENREALAKAQRERNRKINDEAGARLERKRATMRSVMRKVRNTSRGRLQSNVSRAIHRALKDRKDGEPSFALLGFSVDDLIRHLERQFLPGMSWENMREWNVDHIVPHRLFNYSDAHDPDFKACWALSNLRPLWADENQKKGGRRTHLI